MCVNRVAYKETKMKLGVNLWVHVIGQRIRVGDDYFELTDN